MRTRFPAQAGCSTRTVPAVAARTGVPIAAGKSCPVWIPLAHNAPDWPNGVPISYVPSASGQVQAPVPTSYDVGVLPQRKPPACEVVAGAVCTLAGLPSVGRSAENRLSGTVVTTTEPLA